MKDKVQVKLMAHPGALSEYTYTLVSLRGALTIPDWSTTGSKKEIQAHPGQRITARSAKNLLDNPLRYDVTVVGEKA